MGGNGRRCGKTRDDLTGPEFTDRYTAAVHEVIEAKQEGHRLPDAPEPAARPGQLVDLMAALQDSVAKARAARGEDDGDVHEMPSRTANKAAAKKTAKTPGTKTSSRKPRHGA